MNQVFQIKYLIDKCLVPRIEQLQKMFRLAAEKFEGNDRVSFLQLDCKRYREDSKNLDLQKLPTVRVYRNGVKETDLKGDVSVSSMISFVERYKIRFV